MDTILKFQGLLERLFQFETSDLDFGIYRILNYKRDKIENFIKEDLVNKVESAFAKHKDERLRNINQRFEEAKQKVIQTLNPDVFTPAGDLKDEFRETQVGRDYLSIKAQKDEAETIDEIKLQVFNDLYSFFSRFYEEGDFIPQYRYSIKGHKYAIPYNGEEVKLYWANNEQYYTKTGLLFRDYTFKANDYKVIFRIVSAKEELGSNKARKERFFVLDDENPLKKADNKTLIIHFQYRELSEEEVKSYQVEGGSNTSKQEKINQRSHEKVLENLKNSPSFKGWQAKPHGVVKWNELPFNPNLKEKAKELRKAGNLSEVLFWNQVKNKQFLGLDFDRQKIIGNYIVDFYCKDLGLVIEIDGESHDLKSEYDSERDRYLESFGLKVFHILDKDIKQNLNAVLEYLKKEIGNTPSADAATPLKEGKNTPSANAATPLKEGKNTPSADAATPLKEGNLLVSVLSQNYKNEKPLLLYQLNRFTAKNTKDYFIHKNLKKFLSEQLDYFIKAEVLSIETLEKERFLDKHITRAKVVREIGEEIIDFLSQIEDFQKRLWEKKKFVLKTEYVITTDRVPEEFYDEIWNNENQKKEWEELGFDLPKTKGELKGKKLPIDTKYFTQEFKENLLEKLTEKADLDDLLDGLLIKSENWQALNLLLGKYKEKVQTIYIDPPFNKEQDADYLYNVKYKDSTWISCLENRLLKARDLMNERGSIFVRCDYNGNMFVRMLMNEVFGEENFRNEIVVKRGYVPKGLTNQYITGTDSLMLYAKLIEKLKFIGAKKKIREEERRWISLDMPGERKTYELQVKYFFGKSWLPPKGQHWGLSQEKINEYEKLGWIRINPNRSYIDTQGNRVEGMPEYLKEPELLLDTNWTDIKSYETHNTFFPTENSEILLKRVIESTSNEGDLVMDFFLGSGTTTAVAHKLKRKWIGVEMGEHFWSVVLPRMKKVLYYDKSGISKELKTPRQTSSATPLYEGNYYEGGGFFKYQILEQYEDTLDNIELKENKQAKLKFGDDYLLKYFLDYETRESPYLLNIDHLKNPFSYKLKVNLEEVGSSREIKSGISQDEPQEMVVDIPETFNYLLGLKSKKIKVRNTPSANADTPLKEGNGRKYLFILGEKEGKNIAVVWRDYEDNWSDDDFRKDKEFIIKELEPWAPHIVYVNGQSILTPKLGDHNVEIRYIEPEFKTLMR